jgi:hypothetical protein
MNFLMNKQVEGHCTNCNQDISRELARYFYSNLAGTNFEFECPYCEFILEVEAVPNPTFMVTLPNKENQR